MNLENQHIRGLKQGIHSDFEALYHLYASKLYRYCYSFLKNREESEDLIQEVFIKLWQHRKQIQLEDSLSALLFTMVKNRLINGYRTTLSSPVFEDYVTLSNEQPCATTQTDEPIQYEEFCREVNRAKQKLNITQQKVFTLSKEEGLSHKEIALRLNISEQTVKNQLSIGMKIMREALKRYLLLLINFI